MLQLLFTISMEFNCIKPTQAEVDDYKQELHLNFRKYYSKKILKLITISDTSYLVNFACGMEKMKKEKDKLTCASKDEEMLMWEVWSLKEDPVYYRLAHKRHVHEFLKYFCDIAYNSHVQPYSEVKFAYKEYKEVEKAYRHSRNRKDKATLRLHKKKYEKKLEIWNSYMVEHVSLSIMRTEFKKHVEKEVKYYDGYIADMRKKYRKDLQTHKKLFSLVLNEFVLAADAIKQFYGVQERGNVKVSAMSP